MTSPAALLMPFLPPAGPAQHLVLDPDPAHAVLHMSYTLAEAATIEVVLCDLLGRVHKTVRAATHQPAGAYAYAAGVAGLPTDVYLLAFYCDGVKIKTKTFTIAPAA